MTASFHTFGCKLNQYETEALASEFRNQGFSLVGPERPADVCVVNTCTVTSKSEQKARRLIRKVCREHPGSVLIATGCYAQLNEQDLTGLGDKVVVVSQEDKASLMELPRLLLGRDPADCASALRRSRASGRPAGPFSFHVERFSYHTRAFLKVQDGCDYRCSYCRVPLARGRSVSLDPEEAVRRAAGLERSGYREVVLTGVNLTAYRREETSLAGLLSRILAGTDDVRVRLSSLEPEMIGSELAELLRDPRICPHFHIPIQSGSDAVLKRMRRRYLSERVVRAVELLRGAKEDPFLAADMIVGFPGETAEDFQASCRLVESLGLSKLHVFPFSSRPGTDAERLSHPVPQRIRDERVQVLLSLSNRLLERYTGRWVGRRVEVLLEKERPGGGWRGVSENYLKVLVEGLPPAGFAAGSLAPVLVERGGDPCLGRYEGPS